MKVLVTAQPHNPELKYLARGEFVSQVICSAAKRVFGWRPKISHFDPEAGYEPA